MSHLTRALRDSNNSNGSNSSRNKDQLPSTAAAQCNAQQQQQQCQSYSSAEYEERCEAVLTKVYSSCFKVKEHVALAESEVGLLGLGGLLGCVCVCMCVWGGAVCSQGSMYCGPPPLHAFCVRVQPFVEMPLQCSTHPLTPWN